ncbi:OmpA family protein [Pontibacter sp. G13]|uniref:OmpA family protein n=1 Tax=Pontibacter sp. G13 TaxID=3074898 RepID=UPI00288B2EDB|nr:OmpA family protein [Pontibacter sp. G13]WNJ20624.1 OmpA family protein [Pontibacter sp. G13]
MARNFCWMLPLVGMLMFLTISPLHAGDYLLLQQRPQNRTIPKSASAPRPGQQTLNSSTIQMNGQTLQQQRTQQIQQRREQQIQAQQVPAQASAQEVSNQDEAREQKRKEYYDMKARLAELEAAEAEARRAKREERQKLIESGEIPNEPPVITRNRRKRNQTREVTGWYSTTFAEYMPYADYDGDGILNKDDKCPELKGDIAWKGCPEGDERGLPQSAIAPKHWEVDAFDRLYFRTGKYWLTGQCRIALNGLIPILKASPSTAVKLMGHAHDVKGNKASDNLAERRCLAARQYLINMGIPENQIRIENYGNDFPLPAPEDDPIKDRRARIDLVLFDPNNPDS